MRPVYCKNCLSELKKQKREQFEIQRNRKKEKLNFSNVSPSKLAKEEISRQERNDDGISLANFDKFKTINFNGKTGKNSPTDKEAKNEKELAEDEDIFFE